MSRLHSTAVTRSESSSQPAEYSPEERQALLRLAHDVIMAHLEGRELDLAPPTPHLGEPRAAFTTLHVGGQLRGCIGHVLAAASLYHTVAETAWAAAFRDPRFPPVTAEEAFRLTIEISILSPLQPIAPDDIEVGRHGLVITFGSRRGLLLPQVPVEMGWDRETFLEQTCLKAGVASDAWQRGARIEAFTAEVFGED